MHPGVTGPNINLTVKNKGTVSGWSGHTGQSGDIIRFYIESVTGMQRCTTTLIYNKL